MGLVHELPVELADHRGDLEVQAAALVAAEVAVGLAVVDLQEEVWGRAG